MLYAVNIVYWDHLRSSKYRYCTVSFKKVICRVDMMDDFIFGVGKSVKIRDSPDVSDCPDMGNP